MGRKLGRIKVQFNKEGQSRQGKTEERRKWNNG